MYLLTYTKRNPTWPLATRHPLLQLWKRVVAASIGTTRMSDGRTMHLHFEYGGRFRGRIHAAGLPLENLKEHRLEEVENGLAEGWIRLDRSPSPAKGVVLRKGRWRDTRREEGLEEKPSDADHAGQEGMPSGSSAAADQTSPNQGQRGGKGDDGNVLRGGTTSQR